MTSKFSRPNTRLSVGHDPSPALIFFFFFTLRAGVNTSAPACCTDFTQPRQMVLTLHWTQTPAPGTLGKSFRALATLSESTCTHYKHRCNGMCARHVRLQACTGKHKCNDKWVFYWYKCMCIFHSMPSYCNYQESSVNHLVQKAALSRSALLSQTCTVNQPYYT